MRNSEGSFRNRRIRETIVLLLWALLILTLVPGCGKPEDAATQGDQGAQEEQVKQDEQEVLKVSGLKCIHETEFGGVYLDMTIDEFNEQGFTYGDSLTISFSNGYELEDIPYYNGYYSAYKASLLVAYPGYPHIRAGFNNGDDLWEVAKLDDSCTADVVLYEKGRYRGIQEARDIHYEDDRALFDSDEQFANFRNAGAGLLKKNVLYRSASPCDDQHNRSPYVDALIKKAKVNYIIDLADSEEAIEGYMKEEGFASPYFASLYEKGNVAAVAQIMNLESDEFREKNRKALVAMAENDGPYLVHCTEGKDRTGFMMMLIEAFAGASYEEIEEDYMLTYDNYYGINMKSDPEKYKVIVDNLLVPMIQITAGDMKADVKELDLRKEAEEYLLDIGMSEEQISMLRQRLLKEDTDQK